MSNEIKRMNYFDGLLLKKEDLELDQDYHKNFHRMHNRFFHNWGIVDGLKVEAVGNYPQVKVTKGLALNSTIDEKTKEKISQEIWISDNHPDNPVNLSEYDVNEDIYIMVSYKEVESDVDIKKGGDKKIHIWERSEIKHSRIKPDPKTKDEITDIIVARVRLKDAGSGQKTIEGIYDTAEDGVVHAVTQGTSQEFQKISIGAQEKTNLPYIDGLSDPTLGQNDGLEVHSPYTKFSGSVITGNLKANGNTDLNGALSVNINNVPALKVDSKGSVTISKTAAVAGVLSATGGLNVSGDNTTIDTTHVVMTGNMLTVNKYTPKDNETEPRLQSSGVEVYRSKELPYAKLIWDENEKVWKAGTDKKDDIPESGIYKLAYGPDWDAMHNGSNVDNLHKHSYIHDANGNISLTAEDGNVNVTNDIVVGGTIVTQNGIEVPGNDLKAKLIWNKSDRRWQIGIENDMYNIPYGRAWEDLTTGTNADSLHTHSEVYNNDGDLAISVGPTGDVKINSNLTVGEDLTVQGTLTVLNPATEYKQINQVVTENVVIVNKPDNGQAPVKEGGLEVYRGDGYENARIIWDEGSSTWKMGTGSNMSEIPSGIEWEYLTHGQVIDNMHSHGKLSMEDGTVVAAVDKNGNVDIDKNLSVSGNLIVDNDEYIQGDVDVKGSVTIDGDLTVIGTPTVIKQNILEIENNTIMANKYTGAAQPINNEGGLEVYRGSDSNQARLVWNEKEGIWKVGTKNSMYELAYGDKWEVLTKNKIADNLHWHSSVCDTKGNTAISTVADDRITINKPTEVKGDLDVTGNINLTGDLKVVGSVTNVEKTDLKVQDNVILLNKFDGDEIPLNESGLEIFRGTSKDNARLIWDEKDSIWKIGVGNNLSEIACGSAWQKLSKKGNADALHTHGQLYNTKGNILSLSTTSTGNVDIKHDLTVSQDLTVSGNLNVKGDVTAIKSTNIELEGNKLTMNKSESGEVKKGTSTLSVYRGLDEKSAILSWDEEAGVWKIGMSDWTWAQEYSGQEMVPSGNSACLVVNNDGSIQTPIAKIEKELSTGSALIGDVLSLQKDGIQINRVNETATYLKFDTNFWKLGFGDVNCISATSNGMVGIGKLNPEERLDVDGNAIVHGNMEIIGNSEVKGKLSAGSADINGSLNLGGSIVLNGGIEVKRQVASDGTERPNAKILWDEQKCAWTFGFGDHLFELNLNNTFLPSKLYTSGGGGVVVVVDNYGNVKIGDAKTTGGKLDIYSDTFVNGKLTLANSSGTTLKIAAEGLEIPRNTEKPAKLLWNEKNKVWQAGIEGSIQEICLGNHTHNNVCTSTGTEVIYVDNSGNVGVGKSIPEAKLDVAGNLRVTSVDVSGSLIAKGNVKSETADVNGTLKAGNISITNDLTIGGNLVVNGDTVTVNTKTLEVEDNIITLNKYNSQTQPVPNQAGIEVFRGGTVNNAQIIWDELGKVWQAGTTDKMKTICF
ncbi:polymer-forming cytoskeletal protein, partial [Ruminiclostridium josui]